MKQRIENSQLHTGRLTAIAKGGVCGFFVLLLITPFLFLNSSEGLSSELENRAMTSWPGLDLTGAHNEWYGHYVEDRVAFREIAIKAYMTANYTLFHEFSEDLHMYGKEGHVFPADEGYIKAYQHEATDEKLIDDFVTYLDRTNDYLEEKGIRFVFMAGLDKKTVYGQFMPDSIHVNEDKESIMAMLERKLTEKGVPHLIPTNEFQEKSKTEQIYNTKYDSAHWNDNGALYGLQLLDDMIRKEKPEIPALSVDDFKHRTETKELEFIELPIEEEVPYNKLKRKYSKHVKLDMSICTGISTEEGTSMLGYINDRKKCDQTILVFHDSFLDDKEKYFNYRYQKTYFVPRQNYTRMKEYVELLQPDVVVFENAERAFVDDLYEYTELSTIHYDE